jgi:hypothetical protein
MSDQEYAPRSPSYPPPSSPPAPNSPAYEPSSPPRPPSPSPFKADEFFWTRKILETGSHAPAAVPSNIIIDRLKEEGITDETIGLITPNVLTKIGLRRNQHTFFGQLRQYSASLRADHYCAIEDWLHAKLEAHGLLDLCGEIWDARDALWCEQQTEESILAAIDSSALAILYAEDDFIEHERIALAALRQAYNKDMSMGRTWNKGVRPLDKKTIRDDYPNKYFLSFTVLTELIETEEIGHGAHKRLVGSEIRLTAEPFRDFIRKAVAVCPVVYLHFYDIFGQDAEFTLELIDINPDVIFGVDNEMILNIFRRLPHKVTDNQDLLIHFFGVENGRRYARIPIPWWDRPQLALRILKKCPLSWKNIQSERLYRWNNTNLAALAARAIMQSDAEGRAVLLHCMALKEPRLLKQEKVQEAISGSPRRPIPGGRRLDFQEDQIVVDQQNFVGAFVDVSK